MLTQVRIQNFRCLRDVTLELDRFTVFVGPNASGKTALADALTTTKVRGSDHWRHRTKARPSWTVAGAENHNPNNQLPKRRCQFQLTPKAGRSERQAEEVYELDEGGWALANLFDTLTRERQGEFVGQFCALVPEYADIKARARGGRKRLQFQDHWDSDVWYEPDEISDGSILTAAFVALGFQRDAPDLAVFEDPDHHFHPYLQRHIVELMRALSRGDLGPKAIQVVCTTHSKAFLDHLEPEEVRFLARDPSSGETEVHPAPTDHEHWRDVYDKFQGSLGDMWLTGALGGVPGV